MQPPQREPTLKPLMQVIPVNAPSASSADAAMPARRWSVDAIEALYALPLNDLIHRAQLVHREHFDPNAVQLSTLLSIKTGGCPEDCGYCPQAARYHTGIDNEALLSVEDVAEIRRIGDNTGSMTLKGASPDFEGEPRADAWPLRLWT